MGVASATEYRLDHRVEFSPENAEEILRGVPAARGVFALRGERETDEPYLTRAADMRRRLRRLLAPPEALDAEGRPVLSRRLNLRERVRYIEWTATGSEFESSLVLYSATRTAFGSDEARRRLRLHAPYLVRVTRNHAHPRAYVTNRLSRRSLPESFGPFPSRAAAERYCDAVLDLFQLRRCHEDLDVRADHPGCVYGEMKKCMEPCKGACGTEAYATESAHVFEFFATRGASMLDEVAKAREAASEAMDFEQAAALHKQWDKVRAAALLADEIAGPVAALRALVVQAAAPAQETAPAFETKDARLDEAAVFLLERGQLSGPERLSTLGVRAVREQTAVGSSLFAQPLMLAAVPLEEPPASQAVILSDAASHVDVAQTKDLPSSAFTSTDQTISPTIITTVLNPEDRARAVIAHLEQQAITEPDIAEMCDALSLFRRWYYRPEKQRGGEVFLPNPTGEWPLRRLLNGAARVVLGPPAEVSPVDREAARIKTKLMHPGREGVEREVAILPKRSRSRKAVTPTQAAADPVSPGED